MSANINGVPVIFHEAPQECDECGKVAELRPYGNDGACICYECGMKDPKTTERAVKKLLFRMEVHSGE